MSAAGPRAVAPCSLNLEYDKIIHIFELFQRGKKKVDKICTAFQFVTKNKNNVVIQGASSHPSFLQSKTLLVTNTCIQFNSYKGHQTHLYCLCSTSKCLWDEFLTPTIENHKTGIELKSIKYQILSIKTNIIKRSTVHYTVDYSIGGTRSQKVGLNSKCKDSQ